MPGNTDTVKDRLTVKLFCCGDFLDFAMRPPTAGECDPKNSLQLTSTDPTALIPVKFICGNNSMVRLIILLQICETIDQLISLRYHNLQINYHPVVPLNRPSHKY
jgi:hypothetical protein